MLKQETYALKQGNSTRQPQYYSGPLKLPPRLEPSNLLTNRPSSLINSPSPILLSPKALAFNGKGATRSGVLSPKKFRVDQLTTIKATETESSQLTEIKSPKTEEMSSHRRFFSSKTLISIKKNRHLDGFKDQDSQSSTRENTSESLDGNSNGAAKSEGSVIVETPTPRNNKATNGAKGGAFMTYEIYMNRLSQLSKSYSQLPKIEPSKYSDKTFGPVKAYCACTNQGLVRNYNEDRVSIVLNVSKIDSKPLKKIPNCHFFGVYDGHGGAMCAEYCRSNLHQYVLKSKHFPSNPQEALREGFERTDSEFLEIVVEEHERTGGAIERSGSCAIGILIVDETIYIANLGDSRAVVSLHGGSLVMPLTRDHKPNDKQEQKRIEMAGGRIYQNFPLSPSGKRLDLDSTTNPFQVVVPHRVFPGRLSVSRTIGDAEAKTERVGGNPNVVISKPEITTFTISKEHDFILIGSDGIFEKATNDELVAEVWRLFHKSENTNLDIHTFAKLAAESVIKESLLKKSLDNVTAVLIFLPAFEEKFNREVLKIKELSASNQRSLKNPSESQLLSPKSSKSGVNFDRSFADNYDVSKKLTFDERGQSKKSTLTPLHSSVSTLPSLSIRKPIGVADIQSPKAKQVSPRKGYPL